MRNERATESRQGRMISYCPNCGGVLRVTHTYAGRVFRLQRVTCDQCNWRGKRNVEIELAPPQKKRRPWWASIIS